MWARTANPAPVEGVFHRSEQGGEVFHEDSSSWLALLLSAPDDTKGEREQPIQDQVLGSRTGHGPRHASLEGGGSSQDLSHTGKGFLLKDLEPGYRRYRTRAPVPKAEASPHQDTVRGRQLVHGP